jgi:hypothetical protein
MGGGLARRFVQAQRLQHQQAGAIGDQAIPDTAVLQRIAQGSQATRKTGRALQVRAHAIDLLPKACNTGWRWSAAPRPASRHQRVWSRRRHASKTGTDGEKAANLSQANTASLLAL